MAKTKLDTIIEEYKAGRLGSANPPPDTLYRKGAIFTVWSAVDMAFQAIEEINKHLKTRERRSEGSGGTSGED